MATCKITILDEVNCKISGLDLETRKFLAKKFKYEDPSARFRPSYKLGRWDGNISFFNIGGTTYLSLLEPILEILEKKNYYIEVEDLRISPTLEFDEISTDFWGDMTWPDGHRFQGEKIRLRDDQIDVINKFLKNPQSMQEVATGAGKTIITATLSKICEKYGRTIVIVPNKSLVEQTEEDFINCNLDVGVYYGDRKELGKTHTICTWQSLNILDKKSKENENLLSLQEFLHNVQTVIVDECHLVKAEVLKKLLTNNIANAAIRWGLTGTVPKLELEYQSLRCSIGDVINHVSARELQEKGILSQCHVNIIQTAEYREFKTYKEELKFLVTDSARLLWICNLIEKISKNGNTLILVDRIETGKFITNTIPDSVFISGSVKTKTRKEEYKEVAISNDKIIIATYGVAAVGINIPRIFNLMLLEPGKSFVRVIQSIGRGIRKAEDKDHVEIYDITATTKYAKKHLTERKKYYRSAQYPFTIKNEIYQ